MIIDNKMCKAILLILLVFKSFQIFSQNSKVEVVYQLRNQNVYDSLDFDFFVRYNNPTNDSVYVYNVLNWGHLNEPLSNIFINVERLEKGVYKQSFWQSAPQIYPENGDSIFYTTLEKIGPGKSKLIKLNLLATYGHMLKGKYRISIQLMRISNDVNKPSEMSYYPKNFFYFEVVKDFWGDALR